MAGKVQLRREKLRETLLEVAERRIVEGGYASLTAREVAAEAGCAVGAIYNIFTDMQALAAAVNSRTAEKLERVVERALAGEAAAMQPKRQLVLMGRTYLTFVNDNPRLWAAIFEISDSAGTDFAERRAAENARLIGHIVRPLRELMPSARDDQLLLVARALFAAVHGIVSLGLQRRFIAVSPEDVSAQVTFFVEAFCDGLAQRS